MEDTIYRQQAIDEIQHIGRLATLEDNDAVIRMSAVEYILFNLPSAQPDVPDINVGDMVSRQAAIDFVGSMNMCDEISNEAYKKLTSYLDDLPSAQPTQTNAQPTQNNALDCVSRKMAIDEVNGLPKWSDKLGNICLDYSDVISVLSDTEKLPSAQPERKNGHWIRHIRTDLGPKSNDIIECSECRIAFPTENMFRRSFCPNCGSYNGGEIDG